MCVYICFFSFLKKTFEWRWILRVNSMNPQTLHKFTFTTRKHFPFLTTASTFSPCTSRPSNPLVFRPHGSLVWGIDIDICCRLSLSVNTPDSNRPQIHFLPLNKKRGENLIPHRCCWTQTAWFFFFIFLDKTDMWQIDGKNTSHQLSYRLFVASKILQRYNEV